MYELLLASQSPRRRELLEKAGYLFRIDPVKISENIEENVNPEVAIQAVARAKVQALIEQRKHLKGQRILALSADTMVLVGEQLLGKPKNSTEARNFLRLLSGRTHKVITAISIYNFENDELLDTFDSTEVQFREVSDSEIVEYISSGESFDKAGGYAYQGLARVFVKSISGSETNVIGLPMELLEKTLREKGWHVRKK